MGLTASATELTTAATDVALAAVCLALCASLLRRPAREPWKRTLWAWVFVLVAAGASCGAVVHGVTVSPPVRAVLWMLVYLTLGLSVALFLVGAIGEWRGEGAARAGLPWALAAGVGFFALTRIPGNGFGGFIVYEAVAMTASFVIFLGLWIARRSPGTGRVTIGVALTLAAAAVQVSSLRMEIVWPFDHNGLFHLLLIVSVLVIAGGLEAPGR